jgi:hypothetical protein
MPRATVATANSEDMMDDASFESWEVVAEGYGTKIIWEVGTTFVGTFVGVREVPIKNNDDEDETIVAATFADSNGERFWSWQPFALKEAIEQGKITEGNIVRIACTGEEPTKRGLNKVKTFKIQRKPAA